MQQQMEPYNEPDLIIEQLQQALYSPVNNNHWPPDRHCLVFAGSPGSGKNYLFERFQAAGKIPANAFIHDPDWVMQSIPAYQQEAERDPAQAFKNWEKPALLQANEQLFQAVMSGRPIVYIRSLAQPASLTFITLLKALGYYIAIHLITCDIDRLIARTENREKQTRRHIPPEIIMERHAQIQVHYPQIRLLADSFYEYENNIDGLEPLISTDD